jgi:hypothetical protein
MRTALTLSALLGLALASPVAADPFDRAMANWTSHYAATFAKATALAPRTPSATLRELGSRETNGLGREDNDCVRYGCIDH